MILQSEDNSSEPIKSAEEVLQEIDDIIDEDEEEEEGVVPGDNNTHGFIPPHSIRSSTFIGQALQGRKLEELNVSELTQILSDVEVLVRDLSEELVVDLGKRDELEYEKVTFIKPSFILSLIFQISGIKEQLYISSSINPIKKKATLSRRRRREEEEGWFELQILDDRDSLQPREGVSSATNSASSCQNSQKYQ